MIFSTSPSYIVMYPHFSLYQHKDANHPEVDNKKDADSVEIFGLKVSMLHIIIGAFVLAVIILLIVVAIIFICRKRGMPYVKH